MKTELSPRLHLKNPGIASAFELALRFSEWAASQRNLTAESIRQHWGVSRATAYRWLSGYRAACTAVQHKDAA